MDVSITAVRVEDDNTVLTGTGFTKTTTLVYVNGKEEPFTWWSETEILIAVQPPGTVIEVQKGGIRSEIMVPDNEVPPAGDEPVPPADLAPANGGEIGPTSAPVEPTRAETIEEQGIGPLDPYPTGSPPAQAEGPASPSEDEPPAS